MTALPALDPLDGPEPSRMIDYIADFLQSSKKDTLGEKQPEGGNSIDTATHLIAMPMDACHELLLELESVQRAVLYHCPVLVEACIAPSVTRLPLLYVEAPSQATSTTQLASVVEDVVQRNIYQNQGDDDERSNEVQRDDGSIDLTSPNADGVRPLLLPFATLEIDGVGNQVLSTVAVPASPGTRRLQHLVDDLQAATDALGWKSYLPDDPHGDNGVFRPRIPFMRLPDDFANRLVQGNPDAWLTSDQGGNGISPIFWGQRMDDAFGGAARMREVAVYRRRAGVEGLSESAFYLPDQSVRLPAGNAALTKVEQGFQEYQEQRLIEAEELEQQAQQGGGDQSWTSSSAEDDILFAKTRDRLESLYGQGNVEERTIYDELAEIDGDDDDDDVVAIGLPSYPVGHPENPNAIDDWTRERIKKAANVNKSENKSIEELEEDQKERLRKAVESRARVQSEKALATRKDKPPITDNPVFAKYKDGTLVKKKDKPAPQRELPPFPSREHCTGFWRMISSPTGFAVEEGDSSRSDNLVLRVDGTTAGGPILDQKMRQKAAAGTWRMTGDTVDDAKLRIRLVIPPKKERILVMKGRLERVSMASDLPLARATFGIPELEEKVARAAAEMEDLLYCRGSVHIEDAVTGKNRKEIGDFSIMKLNTPTDPSQFTITIPRNVRNQD